MSFQHYSLLIFSDSTQAPLYIIPTILPLGKFNFGNTFLRVNDDLQRTQSNKKPKTVFKMWKPNFRLIKVNMKITKCRKLQKTIIAILTLFQMHFIVVALCRYKFEKNELSFQMQVPND